MNHGTSRLLFLGALFSIASACAHGKEAQARGSGPNRKNVLFISIDDLNNWIGCLGGHPDAKTPHLDFLAKQGALFRNAHCPSPICNPSRVSILTGLSPRTTGIIDNNQYFPRLLPDAMTISRYFRENGYRTAGTGKIEHDGGGFLVRWPVFRLGWDHYFPSFDLPHPPEVAPANSPLNGLVHTLNSGFDWGAVDPSTIPDETTVSWAARKLRQPNPDPDQPFFLGVGIYRPHLPWYLPSEFHNLLRPDRVSLPIVTPNDLNDIPLIGRNLATGAGYHDLVTSNDRWKDAVAAYLASVRYADAKVGQLLRALREGPHRNNTVIVVWSDHGFHLGEKSHWRKFALWDDTTRAPLMIVDPETIAPETTIDHPVSMMDLFPTLVELCGLDPLDSLDGHSLVPLIADPSSISEHPVVISQYKEHFSAVGRFKDGILTGAPTGRQFRYIRYRNGGEELYDQADDPNEWTNLVNLPQFDLIKAQLAAFLPTP